MKPDDAALASALAAALPSARWFAGKSAAIESVKLRDAVSPPGMASMRVVLADVVLTAGTEPQRYLVPLDAAGHDAAASPAFVRWLLDAVFAGHAAAGAGGSFVGHPAGVDAGCAAPSLAGPDCDVAAIGVDASNSSLVARSGGRAWLVKVLRRCRPGIHPEVELGDFFASAAPWPGTPRFRGWLAYEEAGRPPTVLATVHDFVPGSTSAWEGLSAILAADATAAGESRLVRIATTLGRTTASMHAALASRPDLPDFAPEPTTAAEARTATAGMVEHAARVCDLAAGRLESLPPAIADRVRGLLAGRARLLARFAPLADLAVAVPRIRVHGDYHLGQVLLAGHRGGDEGDVFVIDFEGEPGRSLAQRRAKTAAAKDVAGMCRSFDYLLRHATKTAGARHAPGMLGRLENSFLEAYRASAAGGTWWPSDPAVAARLLATFKLDKALYELAYELANRPDWVDVPLAALEESLATGC